MLQQSVQQASKRVLQSSLQQRQQVAQLLISIDISASQRVLQAGQLSQEQQQQQAIHISQLVQSAISMQLRLQTQQARLLQSTLQLMLNNLIV